MKPHKQIISAIALAPAIVLFISLYSIGALFLMDCHSDFLYENFILYTPISILSLLIIIAIIILPTVFVTRKFGVKPIHMVASCFIIYLIYTIVPGLSVAYLGVSTSSVAIGSNLSSWTEVVTLSLCAGAVMFISCFVARQVKPKSSFTETEEESLWYNRITCIILTAFLYLYFDQLSGVFTISFSTIAISLPVFYILLPVVAGASLCVLRKRVMSSLKYAFIGIAIYCIIQSLGYGDIIKGLLRTAFECGFTVPVLACSLLFTKLILKQQKKKTLIIAFVAIAVIAMVALWGLGYAIANMQTTVYGL